MNPVSLTQALSTVTSEGRDEIMTEVDKLHTNGLTYRRAVNSYFNRRLILLSIPLHIRENLINDGSDLEWTSRFTSHVLPCITEWRMS